MLNSAHLFRMNEAVDRWEDKQEIMVHSLLLNELELHLGSDVPKDRVLFSQTRARRREGHQKNKTQEEFVTRSVCARAAGAQDSRDSLAWACKICS